jgi:hypothetical protein
MVQLHLGEIQRIKEEENTSDPDANIFMVVSK